MGNYKDSKFHKKIQQLRKDMKPMTFFQKIDHLWYYYKTYITVFGLFLVVALAIIINASTKKESLCSGLLVNLTLANEGHNYLTTEYFDVLEGERGQEVRLDATRFETLTMTTDVELNYNAAMTLVARVDGRLLDYVLIDEASLEFFIVQDVFADLRDVFTEEELAQMSDRLIQGKEEETGETWIAAIDVSDVPFIQEYADTLNEPDGKIYFAVSGRQQNEGASRAMWDYINAWEKEAS